RGKGPAIPPSPALPFCLSTNIAARSPTDADALAGVFGRKSKANSGSPESLLSPTASSSNHRLGMEANHEEHHRRSNIRPRREPVPDHGTTLAQVRGTSIRPVPTRASLHAGPWSQVAREERSLWKRPLIALPS